MIDRTHPLPITRQARIVNISRGSVYYENEPISEADLKLMRRVDELHLELPFAGARMLCVNDDQEPLLFDGEVAVFDGRDRARASRERPGIVVDR